MLYCLSEILWLLSVFIRFRTAPEGAHYLAPDFSSAIHLLETPELEAQVDQVWIIGGSSLYKVKYHTLTHSIKQIPSAFHLSSQASFKPLQKTITNALPFSLRCGCVPNHTLVTVYTSWALLKASSVHCIGCTVYIGYANIIPLRTCPKPHTLHYRRHPLPQKQHSSKWHTR